MGYDRGLYGKRKGEVMGKWGDGSLHGRRKGEVMGKWGEKKIQVGDREAGTNIGERKK